MIGPGKYDGECRVLQELLQANGVLLAVVGGKKGTGFSCAASLPNLKILPGVLREIADQLERDIKVMEAPERG